MKEFQIVIPTHKRPNRQVTLKNIPESIREDVLLVVACQEDYDIIRTYHKNVVISPTNGIAQKRQWIMENIQARKIYMLDDDFSMRLRSPPETRYWKDGGWRPYSKEKGLYSPPYATEQKRLDMFDDISTALDHYAHAGIGIHLSNYARYNSFQELGRCTINLGYNREVFLKEKIDFTETLGLREDLNVTLRLIRKGYPNLIFNDWTASWVVGIRPGGCSTFRTPELEKASAERLAYLHPGLVSVVERHYKGTSRFEAMVFWRKAYGYDVK